MKHKEEELVDLKNELIEMWRLVISQMEKARYAFVMKDEEIAREVISREKRVDAFELKIDCDCENYIAIYAPVAIDLRLVLSMLKITNTIERIADYAEGIARDVLDKSYQGMSDDMIEKLQIERMFEVVISMLTDSFVSFETENSHVYGKILVKDDELDSIYKASFDIISENFQQTKQALNFILLVKKLERIGDHCSNIVEDIVFYLDAKVLKHNEAELL